MNGKPKELSDRCMVCIQMKESRTRPDVSRETLSECAALAVIQGVHLLGAQGLCCCPDHEDLVQNGLRRMRSKQERRS
jgi:hypothetical protein